MGRSTCTNWDAIIVGAGIGGLALAALLGRHGHRVLVLEGTGFLGGRAATTTLDDFYSDAFQRVLAAGRERFFDLEMRGPVDGAAWTIDTGFHLWSAIHRGAVAQVLTLCGEKVPVTQIEAVRIYSGGCWYESPSQFLGWPRGARELISRVYYKQRVLRMKPGALEELEDIPVTLWLQQHVADPRLRAWLTISARAATTVADPNQISAAEFMRIERTAVSEGGGGGYPHGGTASIASALARAVERFGGQVCTESPVTRIVIDAGVARGVELDDSRMSARCVVSNIPVQSVTTVLDPGTLPKGFPIHLPRFSSTVGVGINVGISGRLIRGPEMSLDIDSRHLMICFSPSEFDPSLAPVGKQLISTATIVPPEDLGDEAAIRTIIDASWQRLEEMFPGLGDRWIWRMVGISRRVNGIAQIIGQTGRHKPDVAWPGIDNLYLVGDCVTGWGVGLEVAARSALICAERILGRPTCTHRNVEYGPPG
jgi:phytoene dehydrogenase-like protein